MSNQVEPYFSIIIPLYNKEKYIKDTIDNVLNQSFQNFEIIIINDGSTDSSCEIIEKINDKRINLIYQNNQGVSVARNNGIKNSHSDYIVFLDADDIWFPNFLETIYNMTIKFKDAGIFATRYELIDGNGQKKDINIKGLPSKNYIGLIPNYFKSITMGINPIWTSAICVPKKIFFKNNIWFIPGEKYAEDTNVWIRIAMLYDVAYNSNVCAQYKIETENNTIDKALLVKTPHKTITTLYEYQEKIKEKEKLKYFKQYMNLRIYRFIFLNIKNNDKKQAIKNFFNYKTSLKYRIILIILIIVPRKLFLDFIKVKNSLIKR